MKAIEFAKQMKILSISYNKDFNEETISYWYKHFENINKDILNMAVKKIVTNNKFMPSIAEILKECDIQKKQNALNIIQQMKNDGYFKQELEYEKAIKWIEKENIPNWFSNDMKNHYNNYLENKELKLIGE